MRRLQHVQTHELPKKFQQKRISRVNLSQKIQLIKIRCGLPHKIDQKEISRYFFCFRKSSKLIVKFVVVAFFIISCI